MPRVALAQRPARTFGRYGYGVDWPIRYEELEPYYCAAEDLMGVAGPVLGPSPRSRPYPLPPHRLSDPDRLLAEAYPDAFFPLPSARPTQPFGDRPECCASGYCELCPIDSKHTVLNSMEALRADPRVELVLGATVEAVVIAGGTARGVSYRTAEGEAESRGDLVALGANAAFNPHLLLRSGLREAPTGQGLCEQVGVVVDVHLDGLDSFQGSTSHTGHGYMLYRRADRGRRAAALLETWNQPLLRPEPGKWRARMPLAVLFEDIPSAASRVTVDQEAPERPLLSYAGPSPHTERGIATLAEDLERVLAPLPVERVLVQPQPRASEGHILCTTPMGNDPDSSVVDRDQTHHRVRNLLVLGRSVFPTCPPANPTLTLCALSLRAAERLLRSPSRPG
ncbi:MAG TPA: GMC oxidoreductase [Candidatus Limnocylindrales bacterium]|nr:GMC oxidoreductase [Candidatus Limnocylindrales bacterium]